jgi:glyoxylase-like metal-dependent hydrolase (beta-lactamase superfamily II)
MRKWRSLFAPSRRSVLAGVGGVAASLVLPKRTWAAAAGPYRVGKYKVTVLSDGVRSMPSGFLWPDVPDTDLAAAFGQVAAPEFIETPNNVTLIEGGDRVILVDAGSGPNFDPATGRLEDALQAAGVAAADVTDLIFTHGHPDHLWGALDDFEELPRFANARHVMTELEHSFWTGPVPAGAPAFHEGMVLGARRVLSELDGMVERVDLDFTVAPGIDLVPTPGHTPGHVAVRIEDSGESLLVIGDALTNATVSFLHPDWPLATDVDWNAAVATRLLLLDMVAENELPVVGFHLPWPGAGRVERLSNGYAFTSHPN